MVHSLVLHCKHQQFNYTVQLHTYFYRQYPTIYAHSLPGKIRNGRPSGRLLLLQPLLVIWPWTSARNGNAHSWRQGVHLMKMWWQCHGTWSRRSTHHKLIMTRRKWIMVRDCIWWACMNSIIQLETKKQLVKSSWNVARFRESNRSVGEHSSHLGCDAVRCGSNHPTTKCHTPHDLESSWPAKSDSISCNIQKLQLIAHN